MTSRRFPARCSAPSSWGARSARARSTSARPSLTCVTATPASSSSCASRSAGPRETCGRSLRVDGYRAHRDHVASGNRAAAARVILSPLVSEPLVFVCPADHPLGRRAHVRVRDLAEETILRFPPGWGVRDTADHVLGPVPSAIEIADYTLMLKLVQERFGTTLMPASAIPDRHAGLAAVPVDDARLRWSLSAAISAGRQPTAAATAVLHALTQAASA